MWKSLCVSWSWDASGREPQSQALASVSGASLAPVTWTASCWHLQNALKSPFVTSAGTPRVLELFFPALLSSWCSWGVRWGLFIPGSFWWRFPPPLPSGGPHPSCLGRGRWPLGSPGVVLSCRNQALISMCLWTGRAEVSLLYLKGFSKTWVEGQSDPENCTHSPPFCEGPSQPGMGFPAPWLFRSSPRLPSWKRRICSVDLLIPPISFGCCLYSK